MIKLKAGLICFTLMFLISSSANSQGLLKKLKQKAENAAERVVDKKTDEAIDGKVSEVTGNTEPPSSGNSSSGTSSSKNRPSNKGGAGLVTTPPDVKENLSGAEAAFKSQNLGEARYAIQQAMLGVEMEIGQKLLKSLPESVAGLPKQPEEDKVTSSGWGWTGLMIKREYLKEDKQLTFTMANNSLLMTSLNMFLTSGAYGESTGGQQKWKQTKVKGNKAVIEYDDSSGYKLNVPIGQSSILVFEGVNFANEQEIMAAVNEFDIDWIKKTLGEK